ncbi:MAG TPA: cyclopropane-fatty-acyl-phospholipid synthase family protein [Allosphingosinicella sp.]|nr:cyclopropane-fatty-acyl-phospholipid synthase family protein [Allosphingosinicella sp.]
MWLLNKMLAAYVKRGELTVIDHDGKTYVYGKPDPDFRPVTVRFAVPGVPRQIARDPGLGAAEAYMDGKLVVEEGDILDLVNIIRGSHKWEDSAGSNKFLRKGTRLRNLFAQLNWRERSQRYIAHHYDVGNDFYRLFLDRDLQYSCGYFRDLSNSLEQAQLDKKTHLASKLMLRPGLKVLDIGCGWGGLALYIAQVADVEVLGITLAEEQLELARERAAALGLADRVKFELMDYRELTGRFDRIVSVGMFEHVGQPHFRTYFRKIRALLADDGIAIVHHMARLGGPGTTDKFMLKYIFPGGYLPALSETVAASEQEKLIMADCETWRLHYVHTIRHWYERYTANRDRIVAMYDERFYRLWQFYLAVSLTMFRDAPMAVYQTQFLKRRNATPLIRDYMFEEEATLREKAQPLLRA